MIDLCIASVWSDVHRLIQAAGLSIDSLLRSGASAQTVAWLGAQISAPLPPALALSLQEHDGQQDVDVDSYGLAIDFPLLSCAEIEAEWRYWVNAQEAGDFSGFVPAEHVPVRQGQWWRVGWIPVAGSDGDVAFIDMDPPVGLAAGRVVTFSHELGPEVIAATGLGDWLRSSWLTRL